MSASGFFHKMVNQDTLRTLELKDKNCRALFDLPSIWSNALRKSNTHFLTSRAHVNLINHPIKPWSAWKPAKFTKSLRIKKKKETFLLSFNTRKHPLYFYITQVCLWWEVLFRTMRKIRIRTRPLKENAVDMDSKSF